MTTHSINERVLRANAIYLIAASTLGVCMDIAAIYFSAGPEYRVIAAAPNAGLGFLEAHGLALILGIALWRLPATRDAHFIAAAVVALLGTCNLLFWDMFVTTGNLPIAYISTSGHWLFAISQLAAARSSQPAASRVSTAPRPA